MSEEKLKNLSLVEFVDKLIEEKNFEGIEDEVREQIKKDLLDRVGDRINAAILEAMPPEKLSEFNSVLEHGDEAEIKDFSENNVPNLPEVIAAALLEFRTTYLGL